jgi:RNA recognition motif-containing protein
MQDDKNKSKGFGFINFVDADGANKAVEGMIGKEINGKSLYAGR